ncbi:MAG: translation initiation factor IF-3 [Acidobacteria bacterium]|nr:translation initiation factor IF-3 [Acidobacteriota bacterium]
MVRDRVIVQDRTRVNERIRAREIRVIGEEGQQLGILTPEEALRMAKELDLDLVEVAPNGSPPVCRIMDYGKFKFQKSKKAHEAKKKQKVIHIKEVKFRPKTDEHDYQFKKNHVLRFLSEGKKVKISVRFRGREIVHLDYGRRILDRLKLEIGDGMIVEQQPRKEGRFLDMVIAPKAKN